MDTLKLTATTNKYFAAFVITYNRLDYLPDTIDKILGQTLPPEKIVVVDNSTNELTKNWILEQNNAKLVYHAVGYNSGPAGGAAVGLQLLANEGYEWIYWGDDNDPPLQADVFERLLHLPALVEYGGKKIGGVGGKGGHFLAKKARTLNLTNHQLQNQQREVDYITGGQQFIVNGAAIRKSGCLPTKELFFSFEDLDICLQLRQRDYTLLVDTEAWLTGRGVTGLDPNFRWRGTNFGNPQVLWRQYYSTRNLLYLLNRQKEYRGLTILLLRELVKIPVAFRYGLSYGARYSKTVLTAIIHFCTAKLGKHTV